MKRGSNQLFSFLRDRSHDLAALNVVDRPPAPFAIGDLYLLSSALQKSIRRGDLIVARRAGYQLLALDRARLWRRLMTVALEDIGIADLGVTAEVVGLSTMKEGRRLVGGDARALEMMLARACGAIKDRSGDHLGSILTREPITEADARALMSASANALAAVIASSDLPWTRRLRAAALLSGRHNEAPASACGLSKAFDVFRDLGVPDVLLAACTAYAARARDTLPILVPLAWMFRATGCNHGPDVVRHTVPEPELIGDWPAYVLDPLHTRVGRRAVDLWLRSYIKKPPFSSAQVAAALWNGESALCDRTLAWRLGCEIRQRAHRADLLAKGVLPDQIDGLGLWIIANWPELICARRAAFASADRASAKPAEALEQATLPLSVPGERQRRG